MIVYCADYNGWLGDFGPLQRKPFDLSGMKLRSSWWTPRDCRSPAVTDQDTGEFEGDKSYDGVRRTIDHFDDISDALSVNSDPVFRWLKDAV
ncbi:hypothetical protein GQ600_2222 [Phytophthora cactorum]|nr:hypothetical protein GQ600_2222 [Phytophthora cactorum]